MTTVLLDEGVPRRLAPRLRTAGLDAWSFPDDWKRMSDASLLDHAEANGIDVLVTGDQNMPFQTPIRRRRIAVLILRETRLPDVLASAHDIARRISKLEPGRYALMGQDGSLPTQPTKPLWR